MTDQELQDMNDLLAMCRRERNWPGPRAKIEDIESRHLPAIREMASRKLATLRQAAGAAWLG